MYLCEVPPKQSYATPDQEVLDHFGNAGEAYWHAVQERFNMGRINERELRQYVTALTQVRDNTPSQELTVTELELAVKRTILELDEVKLDMSMPPGLGANL